MKLLFFLINIAFANDVHYINRQYEDQNSSVTIDDIHRIKKSNENTYTNPQVPVTTLEEGEIDQEVSEKLIDYTVD